MAMLASPARATPLTKTSLLHDTAHELVRQAVAAGEPARREGGRCQAHGGWGDAEVAISRCASLGDRQRTGTPSTSDSRRSMKIVNFEDKRTSSFMY
jgi:hypothetical protein